ncbi:MAG: hypothetical protein NVS1B11_31040 [Terriglobales bacterium]
MMVEFETDLLTEVNQQRLIACWVKSHAVILHKCQMISHAKILLVDCAACPAELLARKSLGEVKRLTYAPAAAAFRS